MTRTHVKCVLYDMYVCANMKMSPHSVYNHNHVKQKNLTLKVNLENRVVSTSGARGEETNSHHCRESAFIVKCKHRLDHWKFE